MSAHTIPSVEREWSMRSWLIVTCLFCFFTTNGRAQLHEDFKAVPADGTAQQRFGASVAMSDGIAIIGAPYDDDLGTQSGSAYVFDLATGQQLRKLRASDGTDHDRFGIVALSGNLALIGAPRWAATTLDDGKAYLFDVTTGQQLRRLNPPYGGSSDGFGSALSLAGSIAVLGAPWDDERGFNAGAAYVMDVTTGQLLHRLTASDGEAGDFLGESVAISGSLVLVGATYDEESGSSTGSAYVFDLTTGQELRRLTASDAAASDLFGSAVALSGNLALIGAKGDDDRGDSSGSVYLFDVSTGQQLHKLTASDGAADSFFGISVALSEGLALVGASGADGAASASGKAYLFDAVTGQELYRLAASDASFYGLLGCAAALSNGRVLLGAEGDGNSGAAYVFTVPAMRFGAGCPGSGGVTPTYWIGGVPGPGGLVTLEVANAVGGSVAFIMLGFGRSAIPMGAGCFLHVAPPAAQLNGPFSLYPIGGSGPGVGWLNIPVAIPLAAQPGLTFTTQAFIVDPGAPRGFTATNGVEVTLQ